MMIAELKLLANKTDVTYQLCVCNFIISYTNASFLYR
jgi:hypothetical protein